MTIIFLDIEGVLTNYASAKRKWEFYQQHNTIISEIDEDSVRRLSEIVNATESKIVLTSTLRGDWANRVDNLQSEQSKQIQELFDKFHIEVVGVTPCIPKSTDSGEANLSWREYEIKHYLNTHSDIETFCIIDDEIWFLHSLKEHLVKTDREYGLQDEHVEKAIRILKQKVMQKERRKAYV